MRDDNVFSKQANKPRISREKLLSDSAEKYRELVENINEVIFAVDPEGYFTYISPVLTRFSHYQTSDLLEQHFSKFIYPDDLPGVMESFQNSLAGQLRPHEFRIIDKDGSVLYVCSYSRPLTKNGHALGLTGVLTNITDRKIAEAALRESEEKYRVLVANLPDLIMRFDKSYRHLYVNRAAETIFNLKIERFLGKTYRELEFSEEYCRYWEQSLQQVFDSGKSLTQYFEYEKGNGRIIFDWRLIPEFDDEGTVKTVLSLARDITEHRLTEEALRKSEAQQKAILDGISTNIAFINKDFEILWVNKAYAETLKKLPEEMVGRKCHELWAGTLTSCEQCPTIQAFQTKQPAHIIMSAQHGRVWDVRVEPVFDEESNLIGVVEIAQDVTERKQTEDALQESEKRYRRITESITDYIYTVKVQDGRPVETVHSEACIAVTGYTSEEFWKNSYLWFEMVYPEDRKLVQELVNTIFSGQPLKPLEHRIIRKDGAMRWVRNTSVPHYANDGKLMSYDGLVQDITERKQMELTLEEERASLAKKVEERTVELQRANAELIRASRLKDEFLATMSHELRTPLNIILGMSEAMQEGIYGPMSDKQRNALRSVIESGHHLLELINDVLDFSNIRTGDLALEIVPVAVEPICQACLRAIQPIARKKRLKTSSTIDSTVMTIRADGLRLKQALSNLLSNAAKFTPEDGAIGLEVTGDPQNHTVYFTVWDTGIGIAKEDMGRLFQPFVQLDSSLSRKYEGTGLGLALVSQIVERHDGVMSVESAPGKGSRFTISLPWEKTE